MVTVRTEKPAFTFTAAVPAKPPPTAMEVIFSLESAVTLATPVAFVVVSLAIHANVCLSTTSTSTPAPMPALLPIASAPAMPRIFVSSRAATVTAAVPVWIVVSRSI